MSMDDSLGRVSRRGKPHITHSETDALSREESTGKERLYLQVWSMGSSEDDFFVKWGRKIKQIVGKKYEKHAFDITAATVSVVRGYKQSFLYDYGGLAPERLLKLAREIETEDKTVHKFVDHGEKCTHDIPVGPKETYKELHSPESNMVESKLIVLTVDMDFFLCRLDVLMNYLEAILSTRTIPSVVDVSFKSTVPVLFDDTRAWAIVEHMASEIHAQLQILMHIVNSSTNNEIGYLRNQEKECIDKRIYCLSLGPEINRTSVFGLLIGYPVLYWYDCIDEGENMGNCLGMVPLYSVKLVLKFLDSREQSSLYAFSFPSCLKSILITKVNLWYEEVKLKISGECCTCLLSTKDVLYPVVTL